MTTSSQLLRLVGSRGQYTGLDDNPRFKFTALICKKPGESLYLARCWIMSDASQDMIDRRFATLAAARSFVQRQHRATFEGAAHV